MTHKWAACRNRKTNGIDEFIEHLVRRCDRYSSPVVHYSAFVAFNGSVAHFSFLFYFFFVQCTHKQLCMTVSTYGWIFLAVTKSSSCHSNSLSWFYKRQFSLLGAMSQSLRLFLSVFRTIVETAEPPSVVALLGTRYTYARIWFIHSVDFRFVTCSDVFALCIFKIIWSMGRTQHDHWIQSTTVNRNV